MESSATSDSQPELNAEQLITQLALRLRTSSQAISYAEGHYIALRRSGDYRYIVISRINHPTDPVLLDRIAARLLLPKGNRWRHDCQPIRDHSAIFTSTHATRNYIEWATEDAPIAALPNPDLFAGWAANPPTDPPAGV